MSFTLGLKKLPFEPDYNQIIYIEGQHDEEVNELIRRNFRQIRKCFAEKHFDFCYIPYLKYDLTSKERLHYNAPYAKCAKEADFMVNDNFILDYMLHPENKENVPPSLLYFHPECWDRDYPEAENQFIGMPISAASFEGDEGLSQTLESIQLDLKLRNRFEPFTRCCIGESDTRWYKADNAFDYESKRLMQEIEERIEKLQQKGIDSYLIEKLFQKRERKLSRLLVTKDFRIYLPDYFCMEIHLTPLPKAVFLLFLNHPEGIIFSYLPDFYDELLEIYKKIKGEFINMDLARKSIADVTNPLSNSINEKCSRIREAFVSQFDDHLARYYYIDGRRGEPKKIALPRSLVKFE